MQKTPLHDEYEASGAKVVDFHGWALPVQFKGIIEEHLHTRSAAGMFDCSHMGEFLLQGDKAIRGLDSLVYSDMAGLKENRCRYSAILNQRGGVIDDCVGLKLAEDEIYLVTNAAPLDEVHALLKETCGSGVRNVTAETTKIDLQGPKSRDVLIEIGIEGIAPLNYWMGCRTAWDGTDIIVTRAGYTGECGYEIFVPNALGPKLWRTLLAHPEVQPCGLGARDTLRSEMGYPLNGEDLSSEISPLESGMERFIKWEKDFVGKPVLEQQRARGDYRRLVAIQSADKRSPRHGFELKHEGKIIGEVTSGTFGPSVGTGIGLARVQPDYTAPGISMTAGPRDLPVATAEIPIYKGGTCRLKFG